MRQDPRLGIAVGVLLSVICIAICMCIIVRHRRCLKTPRQHVNLNGGVGRGSFQNRSGTDRSTNGTTIFTSSSTQITANCTLDGHEMQTLILTSSIENVTAANGNGNGLSKKYDHRTNGGVMMRSNGGNKFCDPNAIESDDEDNMQDMSRCGLISSTPRSIHKAIICRNTNGADKHDQSENVTRISVYSVHEELEMLQPSEILTNGSLKRLLKTKLPQNSSSHSIDQMKHDLPPTISKLIDENAEKLQKSSAISSPLEHCQRNLLRKTSINESSASTSSGLNVDTSSNSTAAPLDHHQSHPYLFNENVSNNENQFIDNSNDILDESSVLFEFNGKNVMTKISAPASDEISIDLNDDSDYQKRLPPKWDYRRPIVGPNG